MVTPSDYYEMQLTRGVYGATGKLAIHADKIKTADDWIQLGFDLHLNSYGLAGNKPDDPCKFFRLRKLDSVQVASIELDKKPFKHFNQLLSHVHAGASYEDFVGITEDAKYFVDGMLSIDREQFREAAIYLHAAVSLNPDETSYRPPYYAARISSGDLTAIEEEFSFLQYDMDSAVHSGRFDIWLNKLINSDQLDRAEQIISATRSRLELLLHSVHPSRIYGGQSQDWTEQKLKQLNIRSAVHERKIARKRKRKGS